MISAFLCYLLLHIWPIMNNAEDGHTDRIYCQYNFIMIIMNNLAVIKNITSFNNDINCIDYCTPIGASEHLLLKITSSIGKSRVLR